MKKKITTKQITELVEILKTRFDKNKHRHKGIEWTKVVSQLQSQPGKLWSLNEMEITGGEPDVIGFDKTTGEYLFCDCSAESPKGRRNLCYDTQALQSRKENKPANSAINMADEMGIEVLNEEQYFHLQKLGKFDTKTSSWILTPADVRNLGGAIFGDLRYGRVFIYHNGAESYYGGRGFRGLLRI